MIKEIGILIFSIITAKDPCKKCIVRSCCTEKCEERIYLENFILKGNKKLIYTKMWAWFIIIYIPSVLTFLYIESFF